MSNATSSTQAEVEIDDLLKQRGQLALADQAMLLADQAANLKTSREVTRAHHRMYLPGFQDEEPADMQLVFGDLTVNQTVPVAQQPTDGNAVMPGSGQPSKFGALAKAGIAAALIGSGAGATVGIPLGLSALRDLLKPQPAATAPAAAPESTGGGESSTSPRYLLELGKPE